MTWKPEILIVDNFLPSNYLKGAEDEIKKNREFFTFLTHKHKEIIWNTFTRWYPPIGSVIPDIIARYFFEQKIADLVENYVDAFWKLFWHKIGYGFEVQVTSYTKNINSVYHWHADHTVGKNLVGTILPGTRILNYIFYVNDVDEGGELEIANHSGKYDEYNLGYSIAVSLKPKRNRLVVIPSWYIHRVTPILNDQERLTINGHIFIEPITVIQDRMS